MTIKEAIKERPNLSVLALVSFIVSFIVARAFTTLNPSTVLASGDYHIHHFWYGLAMLAVGGWIGISLENPRTNRLAAILFGAGGGLIGDEIGLLLTLNNYWTSVTYTAIILIITLSSIFILLFRFQKAIRTELAEFTSTRVSFYFAIFVAAVSVAFILETDNTLIIMVSSALTIMATAVLLAYLVQRFMKKRQPNKPA